jgi:hypothetical protein
MSNIAHVGYHDTPQTTHLGVILGGYWDTEFTYTFRNFFHPFVGELITKLNQDSLKGVMDATWQDSLQQDFFNAIYAPSETQIAKVISFPKEIDIEEHGPYANYNWELFYHIPLTVAVHLSKTRRFAEAQRWFHFIFNPTSNDKTVPTPKRFWNFLAFRKDKDPKQIDYLLELLSESPAGLSPDDQQRQQDILDGYQAMLAKPFQPHAIARTRHLAYQYCVVMKYLDNLIAWGDDLFQQDSLETINEATLLYVLAANILGPRPEQVPPVGTVQAKTFADLKAAGLDKMGNALVDLESAFPFNLIASGSKTGGDASGAGPLFGIGRTLYFCIPRNDKLMGYWDTVADRLFKIRHCMNIEGVVRPLALFDPPIDPGMLVAAVAAGIDVSSIVSGLTQPIGPLRSLPLILKAAELSAEVRNLGSGLLSALEKGDAEHLAVMRQRHEIQIQQMTQDIRFLQWKSAQESTTSLLTSRATAIERLRYYQRLLSLPADQNAPDTIPLNRPELLTEENFADVYNNLVGQYDKPLTLQGLPRLKIAGDTSPSQQSGASGSGRLYLDTNENADLNIHAPAARGDRQDAMRSDTVTGLLSLIPDMGLDLHFWGLGGHATLFGGSLLASSGRFYSSLRSTSATDEEGQGGHASQTASFERRVDDWILQYNLAAHELMQNGRQILTSMIAEQIAQHDYLTVKQQIANAQEADQFLHDKFSNEDLYLWMQGEISRLYYEYYRFAFDTARKAEQTMKRELMRPELDAQTFVQFNYWDSGHKGLLSGEALYLDVKRMEMAYHENNKRELELTRHVSLRQLDPLALLTLKSTASCTVSVPEWLYDKDCPGHYMRRIKSVALSIPSVTGPYTSVNCTLSLLGSSIRTSPLLKDGEYARQGTEDDRFVDYTGAVQSIVTSAANNDSGMFETNLHEDRFLPFEGAGAVSRWKLDLPSAYPAFDYSTTSDVILHIRFTARQGVDQTKVKSSLDDLLAEVSADSGANLALLFSLPHDFPMEWSAFVNGTDNFSATIKHDFFPYFTQGKDITINDLKIYGPDVTKHHTVDDPAARTSDLHDTGGFTLTAAEDGAGPTQVLTRTPGRQVYLIVRYSI